MMTRRETGEVSNDLATDAAHTKTKMGGSQEIRQREKGEMLPVFIPDKKKKATV